MKIIEYPIVSAVAGEIPGVNTIVTYLQETVRNQRDEELNTFLNELSNDLKLLHEKSDEFEKKFGTKIDISQFKNKEFLSNLAKATEEAVRSYDERKRKYLKNFILSQAVNKRPDKSLIDIYWQLIRELDGIHIMILSKIYSSQKHLSKADLEVLKEQNERDELFSIQQLEKEFNLESNFIEIVLSRLESIGLIKIIEGPKTGKDRTARIALNHVSMKFMRLLNQDWLVGRECKA